MRKTIVYKSDKGMIATMKVSSYSVMLYVEDENKNIIINNEPYSGIISAKNALIKLGGNWEFEIKEEE